jgi:hypothetical protein
MKPILLLTGLLLLCAGALMAQSASPKAARSTKYTLFPDFDADMVRLNSQKTTAEKNSKQSTTRNTRELIFKDYKPQQSAARPTVQGNARKAAPGGKLPSAVSSAEQATLNKETATPVTPISTPTQERQAPKQ